MFYKYEKYIRIVLNEKSIVFTISQLVLYIDLFNYYLISLLLTKNIYKISNMKQLYLINFNEDIYEISTMRYWKKLYLTDYYDDIYIEKPRLINSLEPKRSTSSKKIRKFMKQFNKYVHERLTNPADIINEYYMIQTRDIPKLFEYEKNIEILSNIRHTFGYDVYSYIRKFLQ
jgi:hypothetical protein